MNDLTWFIILALSVTATAIIVRAASTMRSSPDPTFSLPDNKRTEAIVARVYAVFPEPPGADLIVLDDRVLVSRGTSPTLAVMDAGGKSYTSWEVTAFGSPEHHAYLVKSTPSAGILPPDVLP